MNVVATNATGYQWQISSDGGTTFASVIGATAASYTTAATTLADSDTRYRVVVSGASNSVTSSAVTLTVTAAPVAPGISVHPADQTITEGQNANFSVTATGTTLGYQWQRSIDGSISFADVVGATNATLTLTAVPLGDHGQQFHVVVSNSAGSVTSNAALLTVNAAQSAPVFTTQPASVSIVEGQNTQFEVAVSGTPAPTLQWQLSTDNGSSWNDISGQTNTIFTVTAPNLANNGRQFRAVASNSAGTVNSNAATLTISAAVAPAFTTQPADVTINEGENAQFTVVVTGTPTPTLQWQLSTDDGANWSNIVGATSDTFILLNVALANDGRQFRAVASNSGGTVNSSAAILTVNTAPALSLSTLVSVAPGGAPPNNRSSQPSISADGNLIAFLSDGTNLVAGVTVAGHAYLRNMATGATTLINQSQSGTESTGGVTSLKLAAEGRFAVFMSLANDLVAGDTNIANDVFLRDLQTGTTTRQNVLPDGSQDVNSGNAVGEQPDISADGRWVLMASGVNLAAGGAYDGVRRLFLRDTQSGVTRQVPAPDGFSAHRISPDGRWVMWIIVTGSGAATTTQIGYYDVQTDDQGIVFTALWPEIGGALSLSADGRHVAFTLKSPTLLGGVTASKFQVVVFDRNEADPALALTLASTGDSGAGDGPSFQPVLSGDGRYVLFGTNAPNLAGDAAATIRSYVMVRDRLAGTTQVASRRVDGSNVWVSGVGGTFGHVLSSDGGVLAFVPDVANMGLSTLLGENQVFAAPRP